MRVEGSENVLISQTGSFDILSRLNTGDTLRAKVIDITANELLLKLFDGTLINAGAMTPVNAKRGDLIEFIVKNKVNNQLFLETLKDGGQNLDDSYVEDEIKNKLIELGIKPDKRNMEVASRIRDSGALINTETITKVVDAVVRFKNLTIDKAAYLISNNIVPEEKSIASLNSLVEGRTKLSTELLDLVSSLGRLQDKELAFAILKELNALDYATQKTVEDNGSGASHIDYEDGRNYRNQKSGYIEEDSALKGGADIDKHKDNFRLESKLPERDIITKTLEKELGLVGIDKKEILQIKKKTVDFIDNYRENIDEPEKRLIEHLKSNMGGFDKLYRGNEKALKDVFYKAFQRLKSDGAAEGSKVSNKRHSEMDNAVEVIKKSFEKMFVKVGDKTNSQDINVKEIYKDIYKKLEIVRKALENSDVPIKEEILSRVDSIKSNINFLNELNNHSVYLQIPLKIFDRNTTGDIYILKRNSARNRIDPENATVFLSLNTKNLGQVDSLITVSKKNVSLSLNLEKDEIIDFIKANYIELYEELLKKNYKLVDIKYRLIDEKVNLLNAHEVLGKQIEKVRSKSFDCKI